MGSVTSTGSFSQQFPTFAESCASTMDLRLIMRFLVRLWRQQPINSTLSRTNEVPETTPISSSKPDMLFLLVVLEVVVGRPPNEDAG